MEVVVQRPGEERSRQRRSRRIFQGCKKPRSQSMVRAHGEGGTVLLAIKAATRHHSAQKPHEPQGVYQFGSVFYLFCVLIFLILLAGFVCCVFLDAVPLSLMPRPRAPSQTIARPPSWACLAVLWPRNGRPTLGRQGPPVQMTMRRRSTWSGTRRGPRWGLAGARPAPPPPPPPPARPRSPRCPRTPVAPPSSTVVSTHVLYTWHIFVYICSVCEL